MNNLIFIITIVFNCSNLSHSQINSTEESLALNKTNLKDTFFINEEMSFIVGKWKHIETFSSDGAKKSIAKMNNGQTIIFSSDNTIKIDKNGKIDKGTYQIDLIDKDKKDSFKLGIKLSTENFYYILYSGTDKNSLSLTPRTSNYEVICDEICMDVYEKIK
jgi:hypothetical protein